MCEKVIEFSAENYEELCYFCIARWRKKEQVGESVSDGRRYRYKGRMINRLRFIRIGSNPVLATYSPLPSTRYGTKIEITDIRCISYIGVDALRIVGRHSLSVLGIFQKHSLLAR